MKTKSETFFTDTEKKAIESAIKEAESKTSGEIVTMVVDRSDGYRDVDVIAGITLSAIISFYPSELVFNYSELFLRKLIPAMNWLIIIPDSIRFTTGLSAFVALTLILYFPLKTLFRNLTLFKRMIISLKRMDNEVRERALRGFYEHGLNNTKDATGVLFLISLMEKRVQILADHGIYTKIDQKTLDKYAASIGKGIAAGKGREALTDAIKDIGEVLGKHFPRKSDDMNELSDRIITE